MAKRNTNAQLAKKLHTLVAQYLAGDLESDTETAQKLDEIAEVAQRLNIFTGQHESHGWWEVHLGEMRDTVKEDHDTLLVLATQVTFIKEAVEQWGENHVEVCKLRQRVGLISKFGIAMALAVLGGWADRLSDLIRQYFQ